VKAWTVGPARVLGIDEPRLAYGARARVTVLDLNREWTVDPASFLSRSTNCPFAGRRLKGKARWTIFDGRIVWADPQIPEKDGGS
jgi:dihydroorotase